MAQILNNRQADAPIIDWLEVIAKAAALGQICDTDAESANDSDSQETTR
ncbi:MAG: hypothetical protein NTX68_00030 [Rhodococcus sp.]|jgi:hypothetical protein|nr:MULTISPECIES: hypothetical protein [Rhodococcus]MCX6489360.1 hypothetical protein [Rhodococcus sp. (in: high G+C Gram-positive bacteria)]CAH0315536.1 hypothetical protein SRABI91_05134 [Rhodococcus fascians]